MAVQRVGINEVGENETAVEGSQGGLHFVHAVLVARRVDGAGDAPSCEQVLDLPDRQHVVPCRGQPIEQGRREWRQREVPAVGGAH